MNEILTFQLAFVTWLPIVNAETSFEAIFQKSSIWSSQEWLEYKGNIQKLEEFTACQWENLRYFSTRSNSLWSYCSVRSENDTKLNCIQLYQKGIISSAFRPVSYNLYLSGMVTKSINIEIELDYVRHRAWNHVCWYYSSETGYNKLYYNGQLIGSKKIYGLPHVDGTDSAYDHSIILGQEPDRLRGGFSEDQGFFGSIAEFNIWNTSISASTIMNMANCLNNYQGNVVSWSKNSLIFSRVALRDIGNISFFCKKHERLVIFPKRRLLSNAQDICSTHGGTLVTPKSDAENNAVRIILDQNKETCSNNFI